MNIRKIAAPIVGFLACISGSAGASYFTCEGQVQSLALGPTNGIVQVNTGHGWHYICSLNYTMAHVTQETCQAWFGALLTAQSTGAVILQAYNIVDGGSQNCGELGSFVAPNPLPYFLEIKPPA